MILVGRSIKLNFSSILDMAAAILRSYGRCGSRFDGEDIAKCFLTWLQSGPKDVGNFTPLASLIRLIYGAHS